MPEKFGGPAHFGEIDKNLTPSHEIKKDTGLEDAQKLNDLIMKKDQLLEKGIENGDEVTFNRNLEDLETMIKQLEDKV